MMLRIDQRFVTSTNLGQRWQARKFQFKKQIICMKIGKKSLRNEEEGFGDGKRWVNFDESGKKGIKGG